MASSATKSYTSRQHLMQQSTLTAPYPHTQSTHYGAPSPYQAQAQQHQANQDTATSQMSVGVNGVGGNGVGGNVLGPFSTQDYVYQQSAASSDLQSTTPTVTAPRGGLNERVQVYVRVRPLFKHELLEDMQAAKSIKQNLSPSKSLYTEDCDDEADDNVGADGSSLDGLRSGCIRFTDNQPQMLSIDMRPREPKRNFVFRSVFRPDSSQLEVFEKTALPLVMHVLNGYNGTYFVFGQTGTGKTHSMGVLNQIDSNSTGVIPESLSFIFSTLQELQQENLITEWKVHISFFQIYLEQVADLLNPESKNMSIREEHGEVFVGNLVEVPVESLEQAMNIVNAGLLHRLMASQAMNDTSSRSHTILHIDVYQTRHKQDNPNQVEFLKGRLVLVDLAGSERVNKTKSSGIRFQEAKHINSSLTALGNVISCLANPSNKKQTARGTSSTNGTFIPYRSSKLTRILTNSLSYDSKIVLLATVGPVHSSFHESVSTLSFAQRCQDIILKPKMHVETEQESPALILERLTQHIAEMEEKHKAELYRMQEEINLRENHIQVLENQLAKVQKHLKDQDTVGGGDTSSQSQSPAVAYRAMQVADMTTFMAKLLYKLTEMSCTLANQFVAESNELLNALNDKQSLLSKGAKSKINTEIPIDFLQPFDFTEDDHLAFESNTSLLTDESIDIASLVRQLQSLAKKHNQSLNLMAEQSKASVMLRLRSIQLEKESSFSTGHLKRSLRENSEHLLNEILRLHRGSPSELQRYLQQLMPKLHELDSDQANRFYAKARDIQAQEYQAPDAYKEGSAMLATFPQQQIKLAQTSGGTVSPGSSMIKQPQDNSAGLRNKNFSGYNGSVGQQTRGAMLHGASIATSHDARPNKIVADSMSPAVVAKKNRRNQSAYSDDSAAKPYQQHGRQASRSSSSRGAPQIGAVLHRHPLHVNRDTHQPHVTTHAANSSKSARDTLLQEHSFASIVKTQQQASTKIEERPNKSHKTEMTDELPTSQEESLAAYAHELRRDAAIAHEEGAKQYYSSVERPSGQDSNQIITTGHRKDKSRKNSVDLAALQKQERDHTDNYDTSMSRKTGGSRRSVATANSAAHQQCRLDNLILISKGMQEKIFTDLEDFFLK